MDINSRGCVDAVGKALYQNFKNKNNDHKWDKIKFMPLLTYRRLSNLQKLQR
jgi:hypothetical protein